MSLGVVVLLIQQWDKCFALRFLKKFKTIVSLLGYGPGKQE